MGVFVGDIDQYHSRRAACLAEVERFFSQLPPSLVRQARLLRNNLAFHFSHTGQFSDILSRVEDYPNLNLPFVFLDDFGFPPGEARVHLEKHLYAAGMFLFAALYTQQSILDESSFFDTEYLYLANALSQEADRQFFALFPANSLFWEYHRSAWAQYAETSLSNWEAQVQGLTLVQPQDLARSCQSFAPYQLIPIGVAILAGRQVDVPRLLLLIARLHKAFRILQDVSALRLDLQQGKLSYPVLKTMLELKVPLGKPYYPSGMLAAMLLANTLPKIFQECQEELSASQIEANTLGLTNLSAYLAAVRQISQRIEASFSMANELNPGAFDSHAITAGQALARTGNRPLISKSIEMAAGYLLSDLTFKESWEVHRRGLAGAAEVSAHFPAGLILEVLCSQGYDLGAQVDLFFQQLQAHDFSYYDHPQLPFADSDTLGVLLRLYPYSKRQADYRGGLETPLEWMRASAREDGRLPVWISASTNLPGGNDRFVRLLGEGCGAIEASLLTGLIAYDWEEYQEIIQRSAAQLLERFVRLGSGISVNYPPGYCLWRVSQLLGALSGQAIQTKLGTQIEQVTKYFPEILHGDAQKFRNTSQTAAFLVLASLNSQSVNNFDERWITILLKSQRSDGSWYGEPLFFAPNRGEVTTWHASHLLTTAYCFSALKRYSEITDLPNNPSVFR